ncbi:RNA methyltransferase [Aureisphaera galaxeae]|uniref:TrmH family RNA methyltransferase n=1 Tax=Aureisphaera galaxeae TaxID=1538023 RepID=UPI00234FBBC2|nr:RNA methyltransferase [Aureisphaera galaxeae]MDC8003702.1 RNA methyltransferase [Aureisphaera galaxeae]
MDLQLFEYLQSYLTERRRHLFDFVLRERTRHFTVVTEDVYQMHNASAVMRSCDVFGIQELHVVEERFGKKMDREIAMGAQKWVDVHRHQKVEDCIQFLRAQGYQIVATTPHDDSCMLQEFDVTQKSAFFFGTEKEGVSNIVLENADQFLKIPMFGFTESLNISVSAAIILQDVVTRMRTANVPWQLSEEEILELKMQWTRRSIKSADKIVARYYREN